MATITSILWFILLLGILVFVHELGHFVMAKRAGIKVEAFAFGFPPKLIGFRRGETEYSINLIPLGGYVRMLGEDDPTQTRSFASARKRWRIGVLLAGPGMNIVLAAVLFAGAFAAGSPEATQTEVQIQMTVAGLPAALAGLQPNDVVISLANQPVTTAAELRRISTASAGREVPMVVRRGNANVDLTLKLRATWPEGEGPMGVVIWDRPLKVEPVYYSIGEAVSLGVQATVRTIGLTLSLPVMVIQGRVPLDVARPVGPVGIFNITGQVTEETAQTGWWFYILQWAALLSAGLGIANLLPIPGLDGGRLLFIVVETIRGRRVSPQREGLIHMVGLAMLLSLVLVITYFDLSSPVSIDFGMR